MPWGESIICAAIVAGSQLVPPLKSVLIATKKTEEMTTEDSPATPKAQASV